MSEMDELKSQAYLTFAEWGPDMAIPRDRRLADCYPQVSGEERALWLQEFARVDGFISGIVDKGLATVYSGEEFRDLIQRDFPFMNDDAVSKAHFLANYYQWHG